MCIRDREGELGASLLTIPATMSFSTSPKVPHPVSYTHLRAHETKANLVCRLLLEKKQQPPRSTQSRSSAASDVYKRQGGGAGRKPSNNTRYYELLNVSKSAT